MITKALADANRLRALMLLREQELCMCQVIEVFGLAPSTLSKHMTILRQAGLVRARKEGRWMYYSLPRREVSGPVKQALAFIRTHLGQAKQVQHDAARLEKILAINKEALCKKQMKR